MEAKRKCENIWAEIFTHFNMKKIRIENILHLAEFALSLPSTSAPVQTVFSELKVLL
jgi:hypothetical protein